MRWKYFVPTVVMSVLIILFNILFLDYVLKSSIISLGEMSLGAKVEVLSVKTKFKNLSIDIRGLKAANKDDVYRNLFEVDDISFAVSPMPLLSMKVIVNDMSVQGVKWGTIRETSGALPLKKLAKYEKQQKKENKDGIFSKLTGKLQEKTNSEITALPALSGIKNAQEQFKDFNPASIAKEDLQSIKELDSMQKEYSDKFTKYQEQIKGVDTASKAQAAAAQLSDLSKIKISSPNDVEAMKTKLDALNKTKDDLQKSINQINIIKSQVDSDLGAEKDITAKINELKDKDIKMLSEKYKVPSFATGGIAKSLFGPVWMNRVEKAIHYVQLGRKYMPPKNKKSNTATVLREKGTDVSFTKINNPPDFLILQTALTGTTGGAGKEGTPLDFKGEISDITSDQALVGRPTKFDINGVSASKTLKINGIFDHMDADNAVDSFVFDYSGLTAKEMNLPKSEYLPDFENGNGKISGVFTLKDENIDALIDIELSNFKLPEPDKNDETKNIVASLWSGINSISVNAKLTGKIDNIGLSVNSNIDKVLSERISRLYGEKIAEIKNKIKSTVDSLTNGKKAEVMAQYNTKRNELASMLSSKQKEAQDKAGEIDKMKDAKANEAKESAKRQAQAQVDAAKKQADEETKKAEEAAKKQAEEAAKKQLKGLFGN